MIDERAPFDYRSEPGLAAASDRLFAAATDVGCFVPRGAMPPALTRALAALNLTHSVADIDRLADDPALSARLLWIVADDADDARHFARLRQRAEDEALALVLTVSMPLLDDAWAMFDGYDEATIIVAPDEGETLATLARHRVDDRAMLHAPLADARAMQIEQLQEEVQRISRMLARLSLSGGDPLYPADGAREPPSPFIEDQVHAPARSYGAEPPHGAMARSTGAVATLSARDVRTIIRQRRLREELFDAEIFADPAWDMMLDLYAARLDRGRVSVSSLCIAAAVPATTALRWIKTLTETGLFVRQADAHDGRRIFVALSDDATQAMHRYFARLSDARLAI
jgi:hypothetical protein